MMVLGHKKALTAYHIKNSDQYHNESSSDSSSPWSSDDIGQVVVLMLVDHQVIGQVVVLMLVDHQVIGNLTYLIVSYLP